MTGSLWLGLVCGALAGVAGRLLLAVFAIAYLVDQIVLGVVLNTLVLGLTGYLYNACCVPYGNTLNSPSTFTQLKIPLLGTSRSSARSFSLDRLPLPHYACSPACRSGSSVPAGVCAPGRSASTRVAADTVGIRVQGRAVPERGPGGIMAGIGGAYFTIGSVGSFAYNMTSGQGYIALAAMIFGRYTPFGAIGGRPSVRLHHALQSLLSSINVPIQSNLLLLTPYVVTIVVSAGLVGKVRGPRAEGVPFIKP